jgi:NAD+ diphosphatase
MEIALTAAWEDRAAALRGRPEGAGAAEAVLALWRGRPLVAGEGAERRLAWLAPDSVALAQAAPGRLWLGRHGGRGLVAADLSDWEPAALDRARLAMFLDPTEYAHPDLPADHRFVDMRALLQALPPAEAALAATARALFNWHRTHRFCAACGAPSDWVLDGWQRKCPACGTSHFPRTDPVVIMLVVRGNRVLLGRSPGWPGGMYSALAGFVEPGETLEAAVRREVAEETGVTVGAVRYVASQPWPWPSSLMLGFLAEAETEAIRRDAELEDARWLSREEAVAVMAGLHPTVKRPRPGAIAHGLLMDWLAGRI